MRVASIRLKNFRAFRDVHMRDIPGFCVLTGANGTGKTTLFSVFSFLRDALTTNVTEAFARLGGELAEEFRSYAARDGQVFVSTHSPEFLNAVELDEAFWLVKNHGYTEIRRARDDAQIAAYMNDGDKLGYLWKQGLFEGADPP
jgi:predicted ATPase